MIAVVVVVALGGAGIWWSRQHSSADPTRYLTATAQRGNLTQTVAATGTVQPQSVLSLEFSGTSAGSSSSSSGSSGSGSSGSGSSGSGSSGSGSGSSGTSGQTVGSGSANVRTVSVTVGQRVSAGAVLATLDDSSQQTQLSMANSQLSVAQSQLTVAEDQLDTANSGTNTTAIAQANTAVAQAQNSVTQAENQINDAKSAVANTRLRAPAAGVVTEVNLSPGLPPPSGAAVQLRSSTLVVQASIAEQDVPKLKANQAAQVTFTALGATRSAVLASLPTQANTTTGSSAVTFPVTLTVKNPPAGLLPGMSAQVTITIAQRDNVLSVPTTAIQGSDTSPSVQVMVNGKPQTRPVEIGLSTEQRTEIVVGLSAGDTVVTGVVNQTANNTTGGGFGGGGLGGGGFGGGGFGGGGGRSTGGNGSGRTAGGGGGN
jgi:macrolide-specific efflux system membrane fusion protein